MARRRRFLDRALRSDDREPDGRDRHDVPRARGQGRASPRGYLNHLVHGNRPVPSNDVIQTLADALGVEPEHSREYRLRVITDRLEAMPEMIDRLYNLRLSRRAAPPTRSRPRRRLRSRARSRPTAGRVREDEERDRSKNFETSACVRVVRDPLQPVSSVVVRRDREERDQLARGPRDGHLPFPRTSRGPTLVGWTRARSTHSSSERSGARGARDRHRPGRGGGAFARAVARGDRGRETASADERGDRAPRRRGGAAARGHPRRARACRACGARRSLGTGPCVTSRTRSRERCVCAPRSSSRTRPSSARSPNRSTRRSARSPRRSTAQWRRTSVRSARHRVPAPAQAPRRAPEADATA